MADVLLNQWLNLIFGLTVKYKYKKILSESIYFKKMLPIYTNNFEGKCNKSNVNENLVSENQEQIANPYILSFIYFQNFISLELLQNQNLIACCFNSKVKQQTSQSPQREHEGEINDRNRLANFVTFSSEQKAELKQQDILEHNPQSSIPKRRNKTNKKPRRYRRYQDFNDDSEYQPNKQGSGSDNYNRASQSKNVPKNFSKAILLFIKRQEKITKKLLDENGVDYNEFIQRTMEMKGKINSIAQLRALWRKQENKYAQIYRILSNIYIRKYSFQHIFNSRVENYSKHLKYRHKMLQVLQNPQNFINMKDY